MNNLNNLLDSLENILRQGIETIANYRKSEPRSRGSLKYELEVVIDSQTLNTSNTGKNSDVYVSAIESIGIEKVYDVCLKHDVRQGRYMAVSDSDNSSYKTRKIGKYYIITGNTSPDKERILKAIVEHLGLKNKITVKLIHIPKKQDKDALL